MTNNKPTSDLEIRTQLIELLEESIQQLNNVGHWEKAKTIRLELAKIKNELHGY